MNGPIAQTVALTCHANGFLAGMPALPFLDNNTTAQFCDRVTFSTDQKRFLAGTRQSLCATTPDDWFRWLGEHGNGAVRLRWEPTANAQWPDRITAGFVGGGGTWTIDVRDQQNRWTRWTPEWTVWNQEAPNQRIWRVSYVGTVAGAPELPPVGLDEAAADFEESLVQVRTFAESQAVGSEAFLSALETLRTGILHGYHRDLSPVGLLNSQAVNLLDAAQSAWVFGGMGSWNDVAVGAAHRDEYERVSEKLFRALTTAIVAAANAADRAVSLGA